MVDNILIQIIREFDEKHAPFIVSDYGIYYQDGAYRDKNPNGVRFEPPSERELRIDDWASRDAKETIHRNQKIFWTLNFDRHLRNFKNRYKEIEGGAKSKLLQKGGQSSPPDIRKSDAVAELKELKAKVREAERCLQEFQDNSERAQLFNKNKILTQQIRAKNDEKNQKLLDAIQSIQL